MQKQSPPPPETPRRPSRAIGVLCNVGLIFLFTTSYHACTTYGCFQTDPLPPLASITLAIVTGLLCLGATVLGVWIFAKSTTKKTVTAVLGLVLTILVGSVCTPLTPLFWFYAGQAKGRFGCENDRHHGGSVSPCAYEV